MGAFAIMPGNGLPGRDSGRVDVTGSRAAELAEAIRGLSTVARPRSPEEAERLYEAMLAGRDGPLSGFVFAEADVAADGVRFWVRAWPHDRYPKLRKEIQDLAGAEVRFPDSPFPAMVCSPELSYAAAGFLESKAATVEVLHVPYPFNGEDFALFLERVPGAMFYLGVGPKGQPHSPDFAADERAIEVGVSAMTGLLLHRLRLRL